MTTQVTSQDFTDGPVADHGVTAVRTPVTVTINNITGHNEYSDGNTNNITIVFPFLLSSIAFSTQGKGLEYGGFT